MEPLQITGLDALLEAAAERGARKALEAQATINAMQVAAAFDPNKQIPFDQIVDEKGNKIPSETIRRQCAKKRIPITRWENDSRKWAIPQGRVSEIIKYQRAS